MLTRQGFLGGVLVGVVVSAGLFPVIGKGSNPWEVVGSGVSDGYHGRIVDPVSGAGLFNANSDPNVVGIDPLTDAAAPDGTDVGFADPIRRYIQTGVYNGDFGIPTPDLTLPIDSDQSSASYNPLAYWRWTGPANGSVRAFSAASSSPSGYSIDFEVDSTATGSDDGYLEQLVPISGGADQAWNAVATAFVSARAGSAQVFFQTQYVKADGVTTTGSATESTRSSTTGMLGGSPGQVPVDAYFVRLRFGARGQSPFNGGTATFTEVRNNTGSDRVVVGDRNAGDGPGGIWKSSDVTVIASGLTTGGDLDSTKASIRMEQSALKYLDSAGATYYLSTQLVAIPFVLLNIPAGATTELQIADNALAIGTPRIRTVWPGSIVGMSYRLSAAVGAGTLSLQATVSGASVWTAFPAGALVAQDHASQAIGTDTWVATDGLGIQAVASAGITAGLDIAALLWVALNYDGT